MSQVTSTAIAQITEVVQRVTRILSNRSIKVVQQGMKVGVEYDAQGAPKAVYLPSLTESPSPELVTAIQGFLDKEVSGLLYTDYDARARNVGLQKEFKKGLAKGLQQIIEDVRTENSMRADFKGSAANFNRNHDFVVDEILKPELSAASDPTKRKAMLAVPAVRAAAGQMAYEELMDGKWEDMGSLGGAILHYADKIQSCASTQESFELTKKIIRKMEELDEEPPEDEPDDGDGDGEGGGGEAEGAEGGEEGEDPGGSGGKDKREGSGEAGKRPSGQSGQSTVKEFQDLDLAMEENFIDHLMAKKIRKMAQDEAKIKNAYTPFSRDFDYVGPLPDTQEAVKNYDKSKRAQENMDRAQKSAHVIQQQIQKLFTAKALVRWEPGLKKGKINASALYRLGQGDPRVFRRRIESDARDIAVSLVVDVSGSMAHTKVDYAFTAAMMFSQVLTSLNIAHEVSCFSTYTGHVGRSKLAMSADVNDLLRMRHDPGDDTQYARFAPITNFIVKGYEQRLSEEIKRTMAMFSTQYSGLMANNVDGESVDTAGRRLFRRKEKRKVMIVMSDGSPAADGHNWGALEMHLKQVVKNLTASGIEMLGLGIMDHNVKKYYPKSETVNTPEEIPTKILELTRQMVVGA